MPFAPEIVLPAVRSFCGQYPELTESGGLSSGLNPTLRNADGRGWHSAGNFGLDQGIDVMMIENHRTQIIWNRMRQCPAIKTGLWRAGFVGRGF